MTPRPRFRLLHVGSLLLSSGLLLLSVAGSSTPSPSPAERVHAAAEALKDYDLQHSIASRLQNSLPIEELPDVTPEGAARDAAFYWQQITNVDGIADSQLSEDDAVSLAVLRRIARDEVEAARFTTLAMPVTPYSSPLRTVEQAFSMHPFQNAKDAEHYLTLLHRVAPWVGTFEARLRDQASRGVVLAAPEIPLAAGPFAAARQEGDKSPFAVDGERLKALPEGDRAAFAKNVDETIQREVNPALDSLGKYLTGDYAKKAPTAVGLGQYVGGPEYYRYLVRFHTTLDLTPEQIHQIGLDEMDRISKALEAVRQQVGFAGTLAEFRKFLRTDAQFFPKSADEIGERMMKNQQRILPRIPEFFGRTPKASSGVERLAAALEGSMTFGYYDPPNPSRAKGLYYYNGSKLDQRSMLTSAALVAHELVPGHHFQIALQRENTALPAFRQNYFTTAYVEGWGEYASDLAEQMGMYQDPYDHAGRLMMDAHLSARLVVDTGMNALGWSRERAMQYLSDNTLLSDTEVATETLRYACDLPGQALAYKMGMKKMVELRERARAALGARFDIRHFHDLVLGGGSMPMNVLEQRVDRWIAAAGLSMAPQIDSHNICRMATIEFTGNYQDLSTDKGYQFKFFCEKCGNGYMSSFQTSKLGMAASAVEVANNLFGGIFGRAAAGAYEVQRAVGGPVHDSALREAVEEIRPKFKQCTRCGNWICEPVCWNHKAGLCETCAPDLEQEMAAAQAEAAREQVQAKAREVNWLDGKNVGQVTAVACASCGAKVGTAKFCPECNPAVKTKLKCRSCGCEPEGSPKFCPECGERF